MIRKWLLAAALALLTHVTWAQDPAVPATPEGTLSFGRALLRSGDSYRAATEFLRFLHHYPQHASAPQALQGLGRAYSLAGRHDEAAGTFLQLVRSVPAEQQEEVRWLLGAALYQGQRYRESAGELLAADSPQTDHAEQRAVLGTLAVLRGDIEPLPAAARRDIAEQYRQLPRKSPALSGTLAAVLPGAGHVYCGRPRDGAVSLILNAVFLWGTYASIQQEQWAAAGILGFFELGWYSGNVVSAVNAAHKWNRREQGRFLRRWEAFGLPQWQLSLAPRGAGTRLRLAWDW